MRKKLTKKQKNDKILCYYWTLDPHVVPHDHYTIIRLGMDAMVRGNVGIRRDYYKMTCEKILKAINGLPPSPEELFRESNLAYTSSGPSLTTGDIICIYGGAYSGMWFVNDIGFVKLRRPKWRFKDHEKSK